MVANHRTIRKRTEEALRGSESKRAQNPKGPGKGRVSPRKRLTTSFHPVVVAGNPENWRIRIVDSVHVNLDIAEDPSGRVNR